uniref:Uncharacterized protein n=1 Tax=Anguilla anguilla TaxID=7936 RepID=A0A0E9TVE5_ANGAN
MKHFIVINFSAKSPSPMNIYVS